MNSSGLNVVITGASAGVGRAVAWRFARAGARVGLIARDEAALIALAREMEDSIDATAVAAPADVGDADQLHAAAEHIEQKLGPADIWVNCAMLTVYSRFVDMTAEEFRRVTDATYMGFVHGTMEALHQMRPRGRGTIVQVGSSLAYRGIPLQSAYCGAKHAIRGFTDSLRCELIADDSAIRLTMVHLPAVNTPQFDWARTKMGSLPRPVPPVVQPEVAADAIYSAAFGHGREYWLGLSTAQVILGSMVAPGFLDHYLARNAISGEKTGEPVPAGHRDNLEHPVQGLHRMRGSFGDEASGNAPLIAEDVGRIAIAGAGLIAAGLALSMLRRIGR